jgi:hypothetical protein
MDLFGSIGQLAGLAAPFLPGPWGAVAGVASQLPGMRKSQGRADAALSDMQSLQDLLSSGFTQNLGALNSGILQSAGIGADRRTPEQKAKESQMTAIKMAQSQSTGWNSGFAKQLMAQYGISPEEMMEYEAATAPEYDPSFNPYSGFIKGTYSDEAIDARANKLFDPASLTGEFANMDANSRGAYDGAVRAAEADASRRGVVGGSGAASRINQIRAQQAMQTTGDRNSLNANLANQERAYTVGEQQTGNALFARGIDMARNNLESTYGLLSGGVDRGLGILGGLQGVYASDVNNRASGINNMLGAIGGTGVLGQKPKVGTPPFNPNAKGNLNLNLPPVLPRYA